MSKKLKIIFSVVLTIIIGCSALPVFAQNNEFFPGANRADTTSDANPNMHEIKRNEKTPPELKLDIKTSKQTENPIDVSIKKAKENRKHRLHQQDEFNYIQKDIEELLLSGATLEDVYRSDELGNQWLVSPKNLIDQKNKKKKSWDEVELELKTNTIKQIKELVKKHPNVEANFSRLTISDAEKLEFLKFLDSNPLGNLNDAVSVFKSEGRSGLKKLQDKQSIKKEDGNR